jgi:hypothetical protein
MKPDMRLPFVLALWLPLTTLLTCTAGNYGATCFDPAAIELCGNDLDDDCDGVVDNGCSCAPGIERPCWPDRSGNAMAPPANTTIQSGCQVGTQRCSDAGNWGGCDGGAPPKDELCGNVVDEDCDGDFDDPDACQCVSGSTRDCWVIDAAGTVSTTPPPSHDHPWVRCRRGTQQCNNGTWTGSKCVDAGGVNSAAGPQPETLDCRDNNCDGRVDEGLANACKNPTNMCWGVYQCSAPATLVCRPPSDLPDPMNAYHLAAHLQNGTWDWNCNGTIEVNYCHAMGCAMGATNHYIHTADPAQICGAIFGTTGTCPPYVAYSAVAPAALPACGGNVRATRCTSGAGTCTQGALVPPDWRVYCR